MRFLADIGVAIRVVEWLRDQGYDARHLREQELQRLPDDQIFRKAVAENRAVPNFRARFWRDRRVLRATESERGTFPTAEHSHASCD